MQQKIQRNSSIELLRIVCMLMIIGGHIIMEHHTEYNPHNFDFSISLFLRGAFAVAVNAFVLISGYFGINFKWYRLLKLDMQAIFYSVLLLVVSIGIGWHVFNLSRDFLLFFPILSKQYWFITCYAVLYIIAPLLNQWAASMDKALYKRLLILGAAIIYLWPTISYLFNAGQFINDSGYGIINFAYLYMLGYYLRHHHVDRASVVRYWGGYIFVSALLFVLQYSLSYVLGFEFTSWISYNTVFILVGAVCLFLAFKNMNFQSNSVNMLAKPCLAVYLIHLHPYVWSNFCNNINVQDYYGVSYILLILLLPMLVYLLCAGIEFFRMLIMQNFEEYVANFMINMCANWRKK